MTHPAGDQTQRRWIQPRARNGTLASGNAAFDGSPAVKNARHAAVPTPPQVAGAVVGAALGSDVYNAGLYLVAQHGDPRGDRLGDESEGAAQFFLDNQAAINAALELDEAAATSAAAFGGTTYDAGILLVG